MHQLLLCKQMKSLISFHQTQYHLHPMKFTLLLTSLSSVNIYSTKLSSYIFIKWNARTIQMQSLFSSLDIQSHHHPMQFRHIFILWNSVKSTFHEILPHLLFMKRSIHINLMKCTNYSNLVSAYIAWSSVADLSREIQSHLCPMKFSHIFIQCNIFIS
jgi:hypothetical protein